MIFDAPDWVLSRLACPRDHQPLQHRTNVLTCAAGHEYAIRDGIPVLLLDDIEQTHEEALHALQGKDETDTHETPSGGIDPFVQGWIGATGGYLYAGLIGRLTDYPIPDLRLPPGNGRTFLDLGCNWGRWSIAAARRGYLVVGIDPSLVGVRSARRVAKQLGIEACFVVGDARHLPFHDRSFDTVFSYSVLQHFAKADARKALEQIHRILTPGGRSLIQLPNAFGLRSLYHQIKRRLREPRLFEVRYWTVGELRQTFEQLIGPTEITVDGFFSLNIQAADLHMLPPRARAVVHASEALRKLSGPLPALKYIADSLYVTSSPGGRS